jgi:NAD(P)-dependent dehydrogenase (short-subunit alcohol dehydrogenase family)
MQGRVVLVTGAGRGIGRAAAGQLAQRGATVIVAARDPEAARAAAADLGADGDVRALPIGLDVSDDESVGAAAAAIGRAAASYGISKAALNALTSTLAAELADTPILVNAVCPGLTATWPGAEQMGARPVGEGAASVVWAATLADDGPSGELRRDGAPLAW